MDPRDYAYFRRASEGRFASVTFIDAHSGDVKRASGYVFDADRNSLRFENDRRGRNYEVLNTGAVYHGPNRVDMLPGETELRVFYPSVSADGNGTK